MAGFLRRLFGPKDSADSKPQAPKAPKPPRGNQAFYLDPDDAKSYGDADYMRTARTVKRTFMGGKYEFVQEVSSSEAKATPDTLSPKSKESTTAHPSSDSAPSSNATPSTPATERRRGGSDLDMFRNMAKDLGKK